MSHKQHHQEHKDGKPYDAELNRQHSGMEHYHVSETVVRQDILAKAKELAELIATSAEVDFYRKAEKQITENGRVQGLISAIKKKQKEAVAFEHTFKNPEMVKRIDEEIAALQDELDAIPIVAQFQQTQSDLNYMLQLVINVIRDTVSEQIHLEQDNSERTRCD